MYPQNNGASAKWFFILAMVILLVVFALGLNIKDAKWLNGNIAEATAGQINLSTDIESRKADLELKVLEQRTELQIAQEKQQAEYAATQQRQELAAQAAKTTQYTAFLGNFFNTLNYGTMAILLALSISISAWSISKSLTSYKLALITSQPAQPTVSRQPVHIRPTQMMKSCPAHTPSPKPVRAPEKERQSRQKKQNQIEILYTRPFWPDDNQSSELNPQDYPLAN